MNDKTAAQFKKLLLARRADLACGSTAPQPEDPKQSDESVLAPASLDPTPDSTRAPAPSLLHALDAALTRIDEGTYGTCSSCGGEIGTRRLIAFPWATLCLPCQARVEKHR